MPRIQIKSDGTGPGTTVMLVTDAGTLEPLYPESISMDLAHDGGAVALVFSGLQVDLDLTSDVTDEGAKAVQEASKLDDLGHLITGVDAALTTGDMPEAREAWVELRKALRS